ncbi:MAG TPA: ester cyclase [Thermoleophilaceae bacterium]|nr:ester cyclase [Thermoleophilaceae bacterium]
MATHDQIVAANRATFEAWNAHDAVAAVFAEDAVIRDVGSPEPVRGRAAVRERVADLMVSFPDLQLRQLDLVVGEDANADRWEFTGTHRGEFIGLAATGRSIKVEGAAFSRFDEHGLVVEDVNFWDVAAVLAQLGG